MGTYWDDFLNDHDAILHLVSLRIILEAFFHYCNDDKKRCSEVLKKAVES